MFRTKLLFLLLPLAINVKAVEIIKDQNGPELGGTRWYQNSSPTSYHGNKSYENITAIPKQIHVESLDSSNNFSPVPLRHVPKPISYGSFGIAKVIQTTPMPKHEDSYGSSSTSEKLYSEKFSGAPLRVVSTQPPPMRREEPTLFTSDVVRINPKLPHMELRAPIDPINKMRLSENSESPLLLSRSAERDVPFINSASSAPLRHVPKWYRFNEVPSTTSTTYRPNFEVIKFVSPHPIEKKLENISEMPLTLVSKPTSTTPVMNSNAMNDFKKTEEPTQSEKVLQVIPKPNHHKELALTEFTELPSTITVMQRSGIPLATVSLQPRSGLTTSNLTMSTMYHYDHDLKGLRLNFTCDGVNAFYSIQKNCDKFVECKDDVAKLYRCPPELHFNPKTVWPAEPCDDKYIVGCDTSLVPTPTPASNLIIIAILPAGYDCATGNGYYSHKSNCGQFIECKDNIATVYACPSGLHFNNKIKYGENPCDIPSVAQCDKPESKFSATIVSRRVADYSCPSRHGYFKIKNDCEQFIKCERSIASSYKCFAGLQFNQNAVWGNDPCQDGSEVQCHITIPPASKFSAYIVARLEDYICPSSHGYYKMEHECEQFIKCENSIATTYKCFSGLQYNLNATWDEDPCASVSIVRCIDRFISPVTETKFSATLIGRVENFACPSTHGYFKNGNNCEEFIKCERFTASSYKCFNGLQFNNNANWGEDPCAKESIIRCHTDFVPPTPKFSAVLVAAMESYVCPSSNGYFRIDNDCEQFVKCERSIASKYKCFAGLQYNHNAAWGADPCASESIIRCHTKILPPPPKFSAILIGRLEGYSCPSSQGYYKRENNCEEFVKCEQSIASTYKCLLGNQFNHHAQCGEDSCAKESIIRCHADFAPPTPKKLQSIALSYKCFAGLQFNQNAVWGNDPCQDASEVQCHITIPPAPKFSAYIVARLEDYICPSSHGYYKMEHECEQFIKCENSIATTYKCFSGLQYNLNAAWDEDPCASVSIVRCIDRFISPVTETKFSATLIGRVENFACPSTHGYFKNGNSCEEFIKCERFTAFSYKCFNGLQFNNNANWGEDPCAKESIIRCHTDFVPPTPKFSAVLVAAMESYVCPSSNGYFRIDNDCEQFVKCERFTAFSYKCFNGLQFNNNANWGEDPCAKESIIRCHTDFVPPTPKFSAVLVAAMESYVCPSSNGYFRIDNDCEQFVKCERSVASKYKCISGLQYNHNAAWGADPCASESIIRCHAKILPPPPKFSAILIGTLEGYSCPSSEGYYKRDNNCEEFVKCERSIASSYKCLHELQFNHHAQWGEDPCAKESIILCNADTITPAPKFSAILVATMESYVCPSSSGYFRIDNDCEQFVKCERSTASKYKCFSGLQFNHAAALEDDPCANESIVRCHVIPPAPKFSAILISKIENYVCPSSHGYYRLDNDCEQFIKCEGSVASKYKCFSGLQYNHDAAWGADPCASESIIRCHAKILPPPPKFSAILTGTLEGYSCPSSEGYYKRDNNCEEFVKCERSIASSYKCLHELQFNDHAQWGEDPCAKESIILCNADTITPAPKFSAILVATMESYVCPSSSGYFRIDNDCEQFVKCERSTASKYKCFSGLQFNHAAALEDDPCASESIVRCHVIPPAPKFSAILISKIENYVCPSSHGYYRLDNDCEQFIKCEGSVASKYKCFSGLQYNHDAAWGADPCASESIIRCHAKILPPPPKFSAILTGTLEGYSCPSSEGYYKRDNNCEKFVKCERSIASSYKCLHELQFNHHAQWGEDPCAKESIILCNADTITPAPKFSAILVATMESYVCPSSSGYFRIDNDCEQFVKCERSTASKYKCFSGLQFNHAAALDDDPCASESIVRCHVIPPAPKFSAILISKIEDYVCPSSHGYYRLDNDCEQFIKCEGLIASKYKCFSGLQYNHDAAWGADPCASESIIRCHAKILPPPPKFSAILIGRLEGYSCPSSQGYYKRDNNCEEFVKCERSIASTYICLHGLQFNYHAQWGEDPCAKESIIRCNVDTISPEPKFSAILVATMENYVCPSSSGYFRIYNDCEQFIKCESSFASSYKCFAGLQFNHNARWGEDPCALPSVAHCEVEFVTPAILITPRIDYKCDTANGYFRKEGECEQFVECKRSVPSLYKCPAGLQFDAKARWGQNPCASASVVRCQVKILSYILITHHQPGYTCPAPTGYYSVKDHCEQFIECQDNVPSLYMCKNGLHFNRYVTWGADPCAIKSVARCENNRGKTPIRPLDDDTLCPRANGYFPLDHEECSKYVVCENGIAKIMPCPSGLVFNATLKACDWPVNVPSCNPNVFDGFSCPAPMARDGAYDEEIKHFRYGNSCKMYIACQEGRPRLLSCDPGKYFDEETHHCIDSSLVHNCEVDTQQELLNTKHK